MISVEWPLLVLAVIALLAAGAVQGSAGFGFNMVAAPILAIIDPAFVPTPMLIIAGLVCFWGILREAAFIDGKGLGFSLSGRAFAAVLAALCLGLLDEATFSLAFGIIVLIAVLLSLIGLKIVATPKTLFIAGAASGFMGTLTSIGAPPMAIAYQNSEGPVMRSTLNAFFVVGTFISIAALFFSGNAGRGDVVLAAMLAPFAFFGFLFSRWGQKFVDKGRVRMVVLVVSSASALILIARQLV